MVETALTKMLRQVYGTSRWHAMPFRLFLRAIRLLTRSDPPHFGTQEYDQLMELYFLSIFVFELCVLLFWIPLFSGLQAESLMKYLGGLAVAAALIALLLMRLLEMSVLKIRAAIAGVSGLEDSIARRARLMVISGVHFFEVVIISSVIKLHVLNAFGDVRLGFESLYGRFLGSVPSPPTELVVFVTLSGMSPMKSGSIAPIHPVSRLLGSLDALVGMGVILIFFSIVLTAARNPSGARTPIERDE